MDRKRITFHLINIAWIATALISGYGFLLKGDRSFLVMSYVAILVFVIRLWIFALRLVSRASLTDGARLGWVFLVMLLPILGSIATLIVVKDPHEDRRYPM